MKVKIEPIINRASQPFRFIVSKKEFGEMRREQFQDVHNQSYEEYCETEHECWKDMFKSRFSEELSLMGLLKV